jgi:uncharacterized protein YcfJ
MKTMIAICIALSLTACAPVQQRPLYTHDDVEIACKQQTGVVQNAAAGAVVGAIFGALVARSVGLRGHYVSEVAANGAVSGGAQAAVYAADNQPSAFDACMASHGY